MLRQIVVELFRISSLTELSTGRAQLLLERLSVSDNNQFAALARAIARRAPIAAITLDALLAREGWGQFNLGHCPGHEFAILVIDSNHHFDVLK